MKPFLTICAISLLTCLGLAQDQSDVDETPQNLTESFSRSTVSSPKVQLLSQSKVPDPKSGADSSVDQSLPEYKTQKVFGKLDFLSIDMPETNIPNEDNMDFTGIHLNLMLDDSWYTGLGFYGAVTGQRGGFFTLGINAGLKKVLVEKLYFDAGLHYGAGGGAAAPDGGGAFLKPHLNLGRDFNGFSINGGWSYVDFFDGGEIQDHQFNLGFEVPLHYSYTEVHNRGRRYKNSELRGSGWENPKGRSSMMVHFNQLKVREGDNAVANAHLVGSTIRLAGFEYAKHVTPKWFSFVKVDGAYDGIQAGYMDVFLGGGYRHGFFNGRTNLLFKLALGAGGGGGVESDGGFMVQPDVSIEQRIANDLYLAINAGYLMTPSRDFYTTTTGLGLKYVMEDVEREDPTRRRDRAVFEGLKCSIKHDVYLDAERGRHPIEHLHQISLQIDHDLSHHCYAVGQTSFAAYGNAGAYAEGLLGLGLQSSPLLKNRTRLFAQVLGGGAGGGDISTGQGLILKSSVGLSHSLTELLGLRVEGGVVEALDGELSSAMFSLGLEYAFAFLKWK